MTVAESTGQALAQLTERERRVLRAVLADRLRVIGEDRSGSDAMARVIHALWNDIAALDHLAAEEAHELDRLWWES